MSRKELNMIKVRKQMLDTLITRYGFESAPTLYFAKWAWENPHNMSVYFQTAMNWHFDWE